MVGLLFPGQGSQFVGMGLDLCGELPAARAIFEEADEALGFSLSKLCFEGPDSELTLTHNAQPAILTHSIAVFRCIEADLGPIGMAAGHSLGEFSAYVAAGSLSFASGVRAVRRRGELMLRCGDGRPGTMAAVLGLDDAAVESVCARASTETEICVAANYNSPGQTVISGDVAAVERAIEFARGAGARRAVRLNVSGAFHSPLMKIAEDGLAEELESSDFRAPTFPVVSNVTGRPVTDAGQAMDLLQQQLTAPVRWADSMRAMVAHGVSSFTEVGPGTVLTGLLRRIERSLDARAVGSTDDVRSFAAA